MKENLTNSTDTLTTPAELVATVVVSTDNFSLSKNDRCDICESQAYFRVVFNSNNELTFCNHHYKEAESKLLKVAKTIYDESIQLTGNRKTAGNGFN